MFSAIAIIVNTVTILQFTMKLIRGMRGTTKLVLTGVPCHGPSVGNPVP